MRSLVALEAMERGVQGAGLDLQAIVGPAATRLADGLAMLRALAASAG
jgi:hypothetical protein